MQTSAWQIAEGRDFCMFPVTKGKHIHPHQPPTAESLRERATRPTEQSLLRKAGNLSTVHYRFA